MKLNFEKLLDKGHENDGWGKWWDAWMFCSGKGMRDVLEMVTR